MIYCIFNPFSSLSSKILVDPLSVYWFSKSLCLPHHCHVPSVSSGSGSSWRTGRCGPLPCRAQRPVCGAGCGDQQHGLIGSDLGTVQFYHGRLSHLS